METAAAFELYRNKRLVYNSKKNIAWSVQSNSKNVPVEKVQQECCSGGYLITARMYQKRTYSKNIAVEVIGKQQECSSRGRTARMFQ